MADDRVFIRCDTCGAWTMLLKHYVGSLYVGNDKLLIDWLNAHGKCHPDIYSPSLGGFTGFSLHTEDEIGAALDPKKQNDMGV